MIRLLSSMGRSTLRRALDSYACVQACRIIFWMAPRPTGPVAGRRRRERVPGGRNWARRGPPIGRSEGLVGLPEGGRPFRKASVATNTQLQLYGCWSTVSLTWR